LYGAPVVGEERAGGKSSVYRFHLDSPIPFTKSLRATIEHGHADHRSDNFYSVAYWYQTEPHPLSLCFPPSTNGFRVYSKSEAPAIRPWFIPKQPPAGDSTKLV